MSAAVIEPILWDALNGTTHNWSDIRRAARRLFKEPLSQELYHLAVELACLERELNLVLDCGWSSSHSPEALLRIYGTQILQRFSPKPSEEAIL